jgi:hypothetical protein
MFTTANGVDPYSIILSFTSPPMSLQVRLPRLGLEGCPTDILERVALALVDEDSVGPPTELPSLLCTSKTIHSKISMQKNPYLYSKIFQAKFDAGPAVRRLGEDCRASRARANELMKRFITLKRFRSMPLHQFAEASTARDDIWLVYILFLEHERNNYRQLVHYGRVNDFAYYYLKPGGPFHHGTERNRGWKVDNELNALVAWLFWFTDKGAFDFP